MPGRSSVRRADLGALAGQDGGLGGPVTLGNAGLDRTALAAIVALTLFRVVLALLDQTELSTDEAQYWVWGQRLEFGAYSKPPLIGWIIRLSTEVLGQSVAAVRLPAALIHGATALVVHRIAARTGGSEVALVAALSYLTMPAVTLGSALMTTDTPMLLAAACALAAQIALADARVAGRRSWALAVGFGLALGLGLLAKHAMVFWLAGAVAAAGLSPAFRIRWSDVMVAGGVLVAVVLPHLLWLAEHGFVTFYHVQAITAGAGLSLLRPLTFLVEQTLVFGPVVFLAVCLVAIKASEDHRGLVVLSVVPVLIVLAQALRGPVLANWAVLSLVPGAILAALWFKAHPRLTQLSLAFGLAIALAFPVLRAVGTGVSGPDGQPLLARYLGHGPVAMWALQTARDAGAETLVADDRDLLADLSWFAGEGAPVLRAVPPRGRPAHHWQATAPYRPEQDLAPVVLIWRDGREVPCKEAQPIGRLSAPPGAYGGQTLSLYLLLRPECLLSDGATDG